MDGYVSVFFKMLHFESDLEYDEIEEDSISIVLSILDFRRIVRRSDNGEAKIFYESH